MNIILGKTQVSMLNPPTEGTVFVKPSTWDIKRTGSGNIMLKSNGECHPEFLSDGMDLQTFCQWINSKL